MAFKNVAQILDAIVSPISQVVNGAGVINLMAMMLIISVDVLLRFIFNIPMLGAYTFELVVLMLTMVVFCGMAYTAVVRSHIAVDLVVSRFPLSVQAVVEVLIYFLSVCVVFLITWHTAVHAWKLRQIGRVSEMLAIPIWPFILVAAFAIGLLLLVLMTNLFNSLAQTLGRNRWQIWLALLSGGVIVLVLLIVPEWLHQNITASMSPVIIGIIGLSFFFVLLLLGMYIGLAMATVGFLGTVCLQGLDPGLGLLGQVPFATAATYSMCVIPLFILLGEFAFSGGLTSDLYAASHKWFGHLPGGLAITSIGVCAGFAACTGSTAATAAAVGRMALPEMKRYKYDNRLATGSIAAGGTLGILIPPSIAFVIYAILTETSVGKLFMAGIFPGLLMASLFMLVIYARCRLDIKMGPPGRGSSLIEKVLILKNIWPITVLFLLVVGGIYGGIFTPAEAAAIGSFTAFILALGRRRLSWRGFVEALLGAGRITAFIFLLIMGANIFNHFLAVSRLPSELAGLISGLHVPSMAIIVSILFMYLLLGCVTEIYSMMIITMPIFLPIFEALDIDLVWFGVIMVIMIEIGFITPPVGVNVFIIKGVADDVPIQDVYRGIAPFLLVMLITVALLIVFPQIALFLPNVMKGG